MKMTFNKPSIPSRYWEPQPESSEDELKMDTAVEEELRNGKFPFDPDLPFN